MIASPANILTVDVEDYFQVTGFERDVPRHDWPNFPSRIGDSTRRLVAMLAEFDVKATFFVLGWVAEHHADLVRDIDAAGHEIGSHSFWHRLVYRMTPDEFREDLRRSRDTLEDITGKPVRSFRAPSFSITSRSMWALDILVEEGFTIDSSIFPIRHDRYGVPDARPEIHSLETPSGTLWELPPSVRRLGRFNLPVSGGGYFRLLPYELIRRSLHRLNALENPFVFYLHPWELDADQPRLAAGSRLSRFRHYVNLSRTEVKLRRLLGEFRFGPAGAVVDAGPGTTRPWSAA